MAIENLTISEAFAGVTIAGVAVDPINLTGTLTVDFGTNPPTVVSGTLTAGAITATPVGGAPVTVVAPTSFNFAGVQATGTPPNYTLAVGSDLQLFGTSTLRASVNITGDTTGASTATLGVNQRVALIGGSLLSGAGTVTAGPACFAEGTFIRTVHGDVRVEELAEGDLVVTASGTLRPVSWVGHSVVGCAAQPVPSKVWPVRIRAGTFGAGLPERDLFLSPGHPVLIGADEDGEGGHLVPIMCLINGTTIVRAPVDEVTYWHVELDAHDVVLAEGLPAESYLDWGDRAFFTEGADHELANPDFVVPGLVGRCRPVAIDGPVVEAERRRIDSMFARRLAAACAWPSETTIGLR